MTTTYYIILYTITITTRTPVPCLFNDDDIDDFLTCGKY